MRKNLKVAIAACAVAALLQVPPAPATAADASIVHRVVAILRDRHVARPDPVRLYAAALEGLREALRRAGIRILLEDLTAGDEAGAREQFQVRFDRAVLAAAGRLSEQDLQFAAASAAASSTGDSHTGVLTPDRLSEMMRQQQNEASFSGIGVQLLAREGRFYVHLVFPGSPAERAGLRPFDRIVAVDGTDTSGMDVEEVVRRIRGREGTPVTLTVARPSQPAPLVFRAVREPVVIPAVEWRMLGGQVGYLRFGQFNQGSAIRLARAVAEVQQRNPRGLVLDLRGNPGGFLSELNRAAELFLPRGSPVYTMESREEGRVAQVTRSGPALSPAVPVVVLVDDATASAAELLAAALRDHGRAVIAGAPSAGAVLVSVTFPLPGGAGLTVAIARILTPRGEDLEGRGIQPEVRVELTLRDLDAGHDSQLAAALRVLERRSLSPGRW